MVLALISGCKPRIAPSSGLTYIQTPKVPIAVSRVDVSVSPYVQEQNPLMALPLTQMLKQWASDHWQPTGGRSHMILYVHRVNITEEILPRSKHLNWWINTPNSDIYKASMMVSCQLRAPNGSLLGKTDFTINYKHHVPENYTLSQRKELWNQVYEGLINQLTLETNDHIPRLLGQIPSC